jgi:hypothetical protein
MFKEDTKKFKKKPGHGEYKCQRTSLYGRNRNLVVVTTGRRSTAY